MTKDENPVINLVANFKLKTLNLSKDEFNAWSTQFEENCKEKSHQLNMSGKLKEFILTTYE